MGQPELARAARNLFLAIARCVLARGANILTGRPRCVISWISRWGSPWQATRGVACKGLPSSPSA
eukprot:10765162-Alexandrium_andersonii.AAC.1